MRLIKVAKSRVSRIRKRNKRHNSCLKKDSVLLRNGQFPELTTEEMEQYKKTWPSIDLKRKDTIWARVYKREHGFSPYFVGLYQSCVIREFLNPKMQLHSFDNKAMCDIYFPDIHFAHPYVRRIAGVYYDAKLNPVSKKEAMNILKAQGEYVIKPALDTMQGTGVEKVVLDGDEKGQENQILNSFSKQTKDFIAQEVLKQHPDVARLNPTSINCCRVTTIYINGKFDYSTILKIGKNGAFRDNWNCSYLVGVSKDGVLNDVAYDDKINKVYQTDNGIKIGGIQLPMFKEMIDLVETCHKKYFPNCGMIGWDVIVDNKDQLRCIEMNITIPGFVGEQLCCGTFFENYVDDINSLLKNRV